MKTLYLECNMGASADMLMGSLYEIFDKKDLLMNRTVHKFFVPDGVWYDFKTGKKNSLTTLSYSNISASKFLICSSILFS